MMKPTLFQQIYLLTIHPSLLNSTPSKYILPRLSEPKAYNLSFHLVGTYNSNVNIG